LYNSLIRYLCLYLFFWAVTICLGFQTASSEEFKPATLQISAPEQLYYHFNNEDLKIPITVSGTDATVVFCLFTKDMGRDISAVRNGYLGWHYVNRIDTCIYVSPCAEFSAGEHELVWDGRTSNETLVRVGEYQYYLWAYDHVSTGETVADYIDFTPSAVSFSTHDKDGYPLSNPVMFSGGNTYHTGNDPVTAVRSKWIVGSDPSDKSLIETTYFPAWIERGALAIDPYENDIFFTSMFVPAAVTYHEGMNLQVIRKFQWIPNGEATLEGSWGEDGIFRLSSRILPEWYTTSGVVSDGEDFLYFVNMTEKDSVSETELVALNIEEGDMVLGIDLSQWWIDDEDLDGDGLQFAGPTTIIFQDRYMVLGSHVSCLIQLLNPYFFDTDRDIRMYENANGDYVCDRNFSDDADHPWLCHDTRKGPTAFNMGINNNLFITLPAYDIGDVSFGLLAPDGTGVGYFDLAGNNSIQDEGMSVLDYGSAYDGMYFGKSVSSTDKRGIQFVGSDCFKGTIWGITDGIKSNTILDSIILSQNNPNPFNPSTTIRYSIPTDVSKHVSLKVFYLRGAFVKSLFDDISSPGDHSFIWDGNDENGNNVSSGIYIYQLKAGEFTRSNKMILIR